MNCGRYQGPRPPLPEEPLAFPVPAAPVAVFLNYVGGPEKTDTSGYMRNVFDVAATWKVAPRLGLGVNGIYGQEKAASLAAPGDDAVWGGVAGYASVDATSSTVAATSSSGAGRRIAGENPPLLATASNSGPPR